MERRTDMAAARATGTSAATSYSLVKGSGSCYVLREPSDAAPVMPDQPQPPSSSLKAAVDREVHEALKYKTKAYLPGECDELGLPFADYEDSFDNRQYIQARLDGFADDGELRRFAAGYVVGRRVTKSTYEIQELLWEDGGRDVPPWIRRKLARSLDRADLLADPDAFLGTLRGLFFVRDEPSFWNHLIDDRSPLDKLRGDFIDRNIWSVKDLFRELGAFVCTGERFGRLVEALVDGRSPSTEAARRLVAAADDTLRDTGFELVKTCGACPELPAYSLRRLGPPEKRIYRFYDRRDILVEKVVAPILGVLFGLYVLTVSLWTTVSIALFLSRSYAASAVAVLVVTLYVLFLYAMLKMLRWSWVFPAVAVVVSLASAVRTGVTSVSPSLWIVAAAFAIAALVLAIVQIPRREERDEEPFREKLAVLFVFLTAASAVQAGVLMALAYVLDVQWFFVEGVEFLQAPPYIRFVVPEWLFDL